MMVLKEKLRDHQHYHNSSCEISLKTINFSLMVALDEVRWSSKSIGFFLKGSRLTVQRSIQYSCRYFRQTGIAVPRALAWLKTPAPVDNSVYYMLGWVIFLLAGVLCHYDSRPTALFQDIKHLNAPWAETFHPVHSSQPPWCWPSGLQADATQKHSAIQNNLPVSPAAVWRWRERWDSVLLLVLIWFLSSLPCSSHLCLIPTQPLVWISGTLPETDSQSPLSGRAALPFSPIAASKGRDIKV